MTFNEKKGGFNLVFNGKKTKLQAGDRIRFYEYSNGKRTIEFSRRCEGGTYKSICEKINSWIPISKSSEIMNIIATVTGLHFILFKRELDCVVYIFKDGDIDR